MTEELKPCPFCGGRLLKFDIDELNKHLHSRDFYCYVECQYCGISVCLCDGKFSQPCSKDDFTELMVTLWNTRRRSKYAKD